jgi:flagellin-like hook-associated protein FlgL
MNIASSANYASPAALATLQNQQTMSGALLSLLATTGSSPATATADAAVIFPSSSLTTGSAQAASTGLQTAASYTQTATGYLSQIQALLSQMKDLAGSTTGADATKFASLQTQLRTLIGGSTAQIGGPTGVDSPEASFDGQALFGAAGAGVTVDTGIADAPTVTVPGVDLQQGAMASLITQDGAGDFTTPAGSAGAAATVDAALQQVTTATAAMGDAQSRIDVAASEVQLGADNLASMLASTDEGQAASQYAAYTIAGQPEAALAAQSGGSSATVLSLLQEA